MVQYSSSSRHHQIRVFEPWILKLWKKIDESKKSLETWETQLTSPRRPTIQIQHPGFKRPNPAQIQQQQTKKKYPNICATVFEGAMGRRTQEPRTYLQIWNLPWILGSNKNTQKQQSLDWCVFLKFYYYPNQFSLMIHSAALELQHQILQKQRLTTTYL